MYNVICIRSIHVHDYATSRKPPDVTSLIDSGGLRAIVKGAREAQGNGRWGTMCDAIRATNVRTQGAVEDLFPNFEISNPTQQHHQREHIRTPTSPKSSSVACKRVGHASQGGDGKLSSPSQMWVKSNRCPIGSK